MKYKLSPFPEDKVEEVMNKVNAVLKEYDATLKPEPKPFKQIITTPETGEIFEVWSQVMTSVIYKVTEVVEETPVVSPIQSDDLDKKD